MTIALSQVGKALLSPRDSVGEAEGSPKETGTIRFFRHGMTSPRALFEDHDMENANPEAILNYVEGQVPPLLGELAEHPEEVESLLISAREGKEALWKELAALTHMPVTLRSLQEAVLPAVLRAAALGAVDAAVSRVFLRPPLPVEPPASRGEGLARLQKGMNWLAKTPPAAFGAVDAAAGKRSLAETAARGREWLTDTHDTWTAEVRRWEAEEADGVITVVPEENPEAGQGEPSEYQEAFIRHLVAPSYFIGASDVFLHERDER